MDRYEWRGDFLGFTLDGVHSSSLGIVRVSDGSRYNEELVPEFEDKIVKVSGRNDTYYFGSEYKQRTFEIKIAFDHLTEKQLRQLRVLMNGHGLKDLIFDEAPYKVYKVKCNGTASLTYLCFEEDYNRIYKGEGTLNFIAYFPFARSRFNYIEEYNAHNIPEWGGIDDNRQEWAKVSGIPSNTKEYQAKVDAIYYGGSHYSGGLSTVTGTLGQIVSNRIIFLKNPGDVAANIIFSLESRSTQEHRYKISLNKVTNNDLVGRKKLGYLILKTSGVVYHGYTIDSNNHLITHYPTQSDRINLTNGTVANNLILEGDFFNIPPSADNEYYYLEITPLDININNSQPVLQNWLDFKDILEYNYLYY